MLDAQKAWSEMGVQLYCRYAKDLIALEEDMPGHGTARAYRYGFKDAVGAANHNFCEMLKPENRRN